MYAFDPSERAVVGVRSCEGAQADSEFTAAPGWSHEDFLVGLQGLCFSEHLKYGPPARGAARPYGDYESRGSGRFLPAQVVAAVLREDRPWPASGVRALQITTRGWKAFQEATASFGAAPEFGSRKAKCVCPTMMRA